MMNTIPQEMLGGCVSPLVRRCRISCGSPRTGRILSPLAAPITGAALSEKANRIEDAMCLLHANTQKPTRHRGLAPIQRPGRTLSVPTEVMAGGEWRDRCELHESFRKAFTTAVAIRHHRDSICLPTTSPPKIARGRGHAAIQRPGRMLSAPKQERLCAAVMASDKVCDRRELHDSLRTVCSIPVPPRLTSDPNIEHQFTVDGDAMGYGRQHSAEGERPGPKSKSTIHSDVVDQCRTNVLCVDKLRLINAVARRRHEARRSVQERNNQPSGLWKVLQARHMLREACEDVLFAVKACFWVDKVRDSVKENAIKRAMKDAMKDVAATVAEDIGERMQHHHFCKVLEDACLPFQDALCDAPEIGMLADEGDAIVSEELS